MSFAEVRFYLDENVPVEVGHQLERAGLDVVSARSLDLLGAADVDHLQRASEMGRVLCTHDQDFLRLASEGAEHAGIAFAQQSRASIGGWVRELRQLHAWFSAEQVAGQVFFLSM